MGSFVIAFLQDLALGEGWVNMRPPNLGVALSKTTCFSGRAKRETAKGRNRTRKHIFADLCRFSLIFGSLCQIKGFGRRRFAQKTAGNRRFLQKPVSPICCLSFGALLVSLNSGPRPRHWALTPKERVSDINEATTPLDFKVHCCARGLRPLR